MARQGKLSPIQKVYNQSFKTFEASLAAHGMYRAPGTSRTFVPYKEASGKYRTGLDKEALYLQRLSPEARELELQRIDKAIKFIKAELGDIDLSTTSKVWNVYSNAPIHASPIKIGSEDKYFDTTTGDGMLNYSWVRVHPQIAPSYEAWKRGEYPDAQYYLSDEEVETKMVYDRKKEINDAINKFTGMGPTKQKQVARLMGIPLSDDAPEERVYIEIDNVLKQSEFTEGQYKGLSTVRVFNEIAGLDDSRIKVKDLVEQALAHSLYRVGVGGKILEGANTIATSKDELVGYLLEDEHQMDLLALQKRLEVKKTANVL